MRKRFLSLLAALAVIIGVVAAVATPAYASPHWSGCLSYNRVCFFTDPNGGGALLISQNTSKACINLYGTMQDNVSSVDNAWNDADIQVRLYEHANCAGSNVKLNGNTATNFNSGGYQWINDRATSFRIGCYDLFNQCYYGP